MTKTSCHIFPSRNADIDHIMAIYDSARNRMHIGGNPTQWVGGYPSRSIIEADIAAGNHYSVFDGDNLIGIFTFIIGKDPSYDVIDGEWSDNDTYGTIHRIASADGAHGIADAALDFCLSQGVNIRIDTHCDNRPMLGWIESRGFRYCGTVIVHDGTPRRAYSLPKTGKTSKRL